MLLTDRFIRALEVNIDPVFIDVWHTLLFSYATTVNVEGKYHLHVRLFGETFIATHVSLFSHISVIR